MDKEKEKNGSSHSRKASAEHSSSGKSAAKKVVSKASNSGYRPATSELNQRRTSAGSKRTTGSGSPVRKKKKTKKKASKNTVSKLLQNFPSAVRFLIKLLCIIVFISLIVTIWTSVTGWSLRDLCSHGVQSVKDFGTLSGHSSDFPLTLSGSLSIKQKEVGRGLAVLTDNSVSFYGRKGNLARNQAHYMANPTLAAESNYVLVYDIGGDRWRFETASSTLCFGKAESTILSGNVSRSGYFSLVCTDSERHSAVAVYDRSGSKVFGWKSADFYITASALSSSGKKLAVCGFNAEQGILKSTVIVFDVFGNKEISREFFSDSLLLDVGYLKSGKAIIIGEDNIITVSKDGRHFDSVDLKNDITAYDYSYNNGLVYCTSPIEGSSITSLVALDTNGNERFSQDITCNAIDVSISSDYVCVLSQGFVSAYTIGGKHISDYDTTVDSKKITVIRNNIMILCNTVLRRQKIG